MMIRLFAYIFGIAVIGISSLQAETLLKYMAWSESELKLERPMIDAFETANPGVKIQASAMPPKNYWPRLSALAAAGDLPDVFWMSSGYIQSWQKDGQISNIADKVDSETGRVEKSNASSEEGTLRTVKDKSKWYLEIKTSDGWVRSAEDTFIIKNKNS